MLVKVEPSGCCVRKGVVQVRFSFYLEPGDARYEEHHIQVPVIPPEDYPGEVYPNTHPKDMEHYQNWLESLPKVWQDNPFHNHFIYVEPNATDDEIMNSGMMFLQESYSKWANNEIPNPKNKPVKFLEFVSNKRQKACEAKVEHLKANPMERKSEWLR